MALARRVQVLVMVLICTVAARAQSSASGRSSIGGDATVQPTAALTAASMAVSPQSPSAVVGNNIIFSAIVTLSNGSTTDTTGLVNWASTSPVIVSLGTLTCNNNICQQPATCASAGASQIQATLGTLLQASTTVTCTSQPPPPPSLVSIAVTPVNPSVSVAQSQNFTATGTYSDGTTKDITSAVNWLSSNTAVATMGGLGPAQQANCITGGNSTISATDPATSISGNTTLTCVAVLTSITVSPAAASIYVASTQQYSATCNYNDGSTKNCTGQTWNSSNATVASINSSGLATGLVAGNSNIDAVIGTITSNMSSLTVQNTGPPPPTLVSITVTPANSTINVGAQLVYTATCLYSDGTTQNCSLPSPSNPVVWASSATGVATISSIGVATGVTAGSTTISATITPIVGSTGLTVQVPVPTLVSIAVTPTNPTQTNGSSILFTATGTYSDGSTQNNTAQATWTFGTAGIATYLAQSGGTQPAQCNNTGSTTIIATIGSITNNTTLTCTPPLIITGENAYCGSTTDASCFTGNQTDGPAALPTHGMYTGINGTPSPGTTINVTSNATMQSALASVTCGQTIVMHVSGNPYAGFQLPAKGCDAAHWITIETDQLTAPGFPAEHNIVTPCQANQASVANYPTYTCSSPSQLLAQVVCATVSNGACISGATGFNYYRLMGLEVFCNPTGTTIIADCVLQSNVGSHFIMDRSIIHGPAYSCTATAGVYTCPAYDVTHGIIFSNMTYAAFINGWIYNIGTSGTFSDAVALGLGANGCTPGGEDVKKVYNVMLSSTGEAFFAGGSGCGTGTVTPNDFEIRNYHTFKPVVWMQCNGDGNGNGCRGQHPELKNNGELKNANRVLMEGFVCENSWSSWQTDQSGYCHLLTPKNQSIFNIVTASSDSTGTILTGAFSPSVAGPGCAPGGCLIVFNNIKSRVTAYNAGPPVTVTITPATTPNLTNQSTKSYLPGLNPNATVTNVTIRWGRIINSRNGFQLASAADDGGDVSQGLNHFSVHDIRIEGLSQVINNETPGFLGGQQCVEELNGVPAPANLHDWTLEHMTCVGFIPGSNFANNGSDYACDGDDSTGSGSGTMTNRIVRNNIGMSGGVTGYSGNCTFYPAGNGLVNNIVKQSGTSWVYTKNVIGVGLWTNQSTGLPFPATNADPGDTPPGSGCGTSQATCHPRGVSAFEGLFTSYNSGTGQIGIGGNYTLPGGSPYIGQATDATNIGVSNDATLATKTAGVYSPTTYNPASITTASLPNGIVGQGYTASLLANSASPAQQWFIAPGTSGILPPGITLSMTAQPGNWALVGTPTASGTYTFTLEMMDMVQQSSTATYTVTIAPSSGGGPNWQLAFTMPSNITSAIYFDIRQKAGGGGVANEWYMSSEGQNGDITAVYKSTNQGASWTNITSSISLPNAPHEVFYTVQVNPVDGALIVGSAIRVGAPPHSPAHIYRSTDDGNTWTLLTASPSGWQFQASPLNGEPLGGSTIVLGTYGAPNLSTVYSTNQGVTNTCCGTYGSANGDGLFWSAFYDPIDSSFWFCTEQQGCAKSSNGGVSGSIIIPSTLFSPGQLGDCFGIAADQNNDLFFACNGGLYRAVGSGTSYTTSVVFGAGQGQNVWEDSLHSMYYSRYNSGDRSPFNSIFRSTSNGASGTWTAWDTGLPQLLQCQPIVENTNDGMIYALCNTFRNQIANVYRTPK